MDEDTKKEITRLCLEEVMLNNLKVSSDIDETKTHILQVTGKVSTITDLLEEVAKSDYRYIHPAWSIELYLGRN